MLSTKSGLTLTKNLKYTAATNPNTGTTNQTGVPIPPWGTARGWNHIDNSTTTTFCSTIFWWIILFIGSNYESWKYESCYFHEFINQLVLVGKKNSWKFGFVVLVIEYSDSVKKVPKNVFYTLLNNHLTALLYCYVKCLQNNVIANSFMYI